MTNIKEKGHNINLASIIIHKVNKMAGKKESNLKLANGVLKITKQEIHFIADIRESFNKRSVPTHGIFEDAFDYNAFQQSIRDYKDQKIDFLNFTTKSMEHYKRVIETSAPATGGFIIFADFKITDRNDERYILVFSTNNQQGYKLNDDELSLRQIMRLELNKIDVATIINITRWNMAITNPDDVKTYLSFIRGKKKLSDYFQTFIGCADKTTATESSTRLLNSINSYCDDKGYDDKKRKEIKRKIFDYCQECHKNKKEILLTSISAIIDDENPDSFSAYASNENNGVSEVIKYDSKILRSLKFIEYTSDDFTIKINKQLIGKSAKYNKDKKTLTLTNLPDELVAQLQ